MCVSVKILANYVTIFWEDQIFDEGLDKDEKIVFPLLRFTRGVFETKELVFSIKKYKHSDFCPF